MGDADFGDAEFEPSDEQLQALAHEAFADVSARHRIALERLREEIAERRAKVLAKGPSR